MRSEITSEPLAAVQTWINAFNANDRESVIDLYAPDSVLWGTFAADLISTRAALVEYFDRAFESQPGPAVELQSSSVQAFGGFAVVSGAYLLRFSVGGQLQFLPARFTFALAWQSSKWAIVTHHSSVTPVSPAR